MSLNGLEDPKLKEAYETAVAEAGRWYEQSLPPLYLRKEKKRTYRADW